MAAAVKLKGVQSGVMRTPSEQGPRPARSLEIEVMRPFGHLTGTAWLPHAADPKAMVLMHPGSGGSDRDNHGYFSAIRQHLLARGCGVVSFDKRGVGTSDGSWWLASIEDQADDVIASVSHLRELIGTPNVGLFGHSQGGWVVLEAAARGVGTSFLISNSGPGVSPVTQERFATKTRLRAAGVSARTITDTLAIYDRLIELARRDAPLRVARDHLAAAAGSRLTATSWIGLTNDDRSWLTMTRLVTYDPAPALDAVEVPLLVIYGENDELVPVAASERAVRTRVPSEHLSLRVLAGADHRLQTGDPPALDLPYFRTLDLFLTPHLGT